MGQTGQLGASEGETHLWRAAPTGLPANFTAPTSRYRRQAWLAVLGLATFVFLYLGALVLSAFAFVRIVLTADQSGPSLGRTTVAAVSLFIFMLFLSGLFTPRGSRDLPAVELDPASHPRLFEFVASLARDVGAPVPARIVLTPDVAAAVVSDASLRHLFWPGEKRLVLGLGLVNVLTLDEFTAVVAHELGHFAQRTMTVGIWASVAARVSQAIVYRRGLFDATARLIPSFAGWVGHGLRGLLWAWRVVLDAAYRVAVTAERALSREMEFQADRVAVSVAGSDSIVHALHRLRAADEAWERVVQFALAELDDGRRPLDLYAAQLDIIEQLGRVRGEPTFGATPTRPRKNRDAHRVFDASSAEPPQLWSTHPSNDDREARAKEHYLASTLDPRSPWMLFDDVEGLRRTSSALALASHEAEVDALEMGPDATRDRMRAWFERAHFDPAYQGVYLGRWPVLHESDHEKLVDAAELARLVASRDALLAHAAKLYPATLRSDHLELRAHKRDVELLAAYLDGRLPFVGGVARYRGRDVGRRQLRKLHGLASARRAELEAVLARHDTSARTVGLALATRAEGGWPEYVRSLHALLHASCHAAYETADALEAYAHLRSVALLDEQIDEAEMKTVLAGAREVYDVGCATTDLWERLQMPENLRAAFEAYGGARALAATRPFGPPTAASLDGWTSTARSSVLHVIGVWRALALATLDELLECEARLLEAFRDATDIGGAPPPALVPGPWPVRVSGTERQLDHRLSAWIRFRTGDGLVWGFLRLVVALVVLGPALLVAWTFESERTVVVANGLATDVLVSLDGESWASVPARRTRALLASQWWFEVRSRELTGQEIESFTAPAGYTPSVYDVARSAVAVCTTNGEVLGSARWFALDPRDYPTRGQPGGIEAIVAGVAALSDRDPETQWAALSETADREALVLAHLRFDPLEQLGPWLALAGRHPESAVPVLRARTARHADATAVELTLQDLGDEEACARARAWRDAAPNDPDATFLVLRCDGAPAEAVLAAHAQHGPHPWLAWLAVYDLVEQGRFDDALSALGVARASTMASTLGDGLPIEVLRVAHRARSLGATVSSSYRQLVLSDAYRPRVAELLDLLEPNSAVPSSLRVQVARAMEVGDLAAASSAVGVTDDLAVQIAASYGADPALRERVADGDWVGLDGRAAAYRRALRIAMGRPDAPGEPDRCRSDEAWRHLVAPDLADHIDEVREHTERSLACQGETAALLAIILGPTRTPTSVIADADGLLFPDEHPSFVVSATPGSTAVGTTIVSP